jgi:hypothetical protein
MCFSQTLRSKILKNKAKNNISLFNPSRKMSVLLQSNKKYGLSHLIFFKIWATKVGFPSQNHSFIGDKICFSQILRWKILKYKGPVVNILFDLSKTMLVLLQSNKKVRHSYLFLEISVAKVGISYYNDILKTQL